MAIDYSKIKFDSVGYMNKGDAEYEMNWDRDMAYWPNYSSFGGKTTINIEYDKDHTNPTEAYCRFRITCPNESRNSWNYYYALLNPTDKDKRQLIKIKGKWTAGQDPDFPYYSTEYENTATKGIFIVKKEYNEKVFKMPPVWIINDGQNVTVSSTSKSDKETWADVFYKAYSPGGKRYSTLDSLVRKYKGMNLEADANSGYLATNVVTGSVFVMDNKDSTYTISATPGTKGTNNPTKSASLTYTDIEADSSVSKGKITWTTKDKKEIKKSIQENPHNVPKNLDGYQIKATLTTTGTYGPPAVTDHAAYIANYVAPGVPSIPEIRYEKNRLTVREDWRYYWNGAAAANNSSPIFGYRIQILKNGEPITGLEVNRGLYENDDLIVKNSTHTLNYVDFEGCPCSIHFNPVQLGFLAHDTVTIKICAYTKNGLGTQLFGEFVSAETLEVQNAGIVHVKVGNSWREGQVWVKVVNSSGKGEWVEAETVLVKVATSSKPTGEWKEST